MPEKLLTGTLRIKTNVKQINMFKRWFGLKNKKTNFQLRTFIRKPLVTITSGYWRPSAEQRRSDSTRRL